MRRQADREAVRAATDQRAEKEKYRMKLVILVIFIKKITIMLLVAFKLKMKGISVYTKKPSILKMKEAMNGILMMIIMQIMVNKMTMARATLKITRHLLMLELYFFWTYASFKYKMENGRQEKFKVWRQVGYGILIMCLITYTLLILLDRLRLPWPRMDLMGHLALIVKSLKTWGQRTSRSGGGESKWRYFDQMHGLLKNDFAVHPQNIVETGAAGFNRTSSSMLPTRFTSFASC